MFCCRAATPTPSAYLDRPPETLTAACRGPKPVANPVGLGLTGSYRAPVASLGQVSIH
jgi:hypothetical protein